MANQLVSFPKGVMRRGWGGAGKGSEVSSSIYKLALVSPPEKPSHASVKEFRLRVSPLEVTFAINDAAAMTGHRVLASELRNKKHRRLLFFFFGWGQLFSHAVPKKKNAALSFFSLSLALFTLSFSSSDLGFH